MKKLFIFAMLGIAFNSNAQLNLNLQGCYPLDCDQAKNFAPPGSTLDGSPFNVTCANGHTGLANTAYEFAGNNTSYISLPASPLLKPNAITVTGWYYVEQATINSGAYLVFTKSSCSTNQEAYALCVSGQKFTVVKSGNISPTCQRDILNGPSVVANRWYFVAFYIDNSVIEMYVDGCSSGTFYNMNTTINWDYVAGKKVILGGSQEAVDAPFKGRMDNLRFYNRKLTAAEICTLFDKDPRCQYDGSKIATALPVTLGESSIAGMGQNVPNPFNESTLISYNTPSEFAKAQIVITTIDGKLVKAMDITTHGDGTVNLDTNEFSKGFYMYSLVVDGKTIETRKMIKE